MAGAATRDSMLDAASQEILQSGYAAASLSSIAGRLGLTKGAMSRQFPAKEEFALALLERYRLTAGEEHEKAHEVYPECGIRGLIRFFLGVGVRTAGNVQMQAGQALIADRATPSVPLANLLRDWTRYVESFVAQAVGGEIIDASADVSVLSEYIVITNLAEGAFGSKVYAADRRTPRLRYLRYTLRGAGVPNADQIIDEVLESRARDSIKVMPPRGGISGARRHG